MKWSNIINSFLLYVIFIILILLAVGVIKTETKVDNKQKSLQTTIDSLRSEIDTLQVERQKYDEEIISLQDSVVSVLGQIHTKENRLNNLKHEYEVKINNIDKLSSDELTSILSERYK
jgi:peptidoglycan hydrolase CwlO-like protein